MLFVQREGTTGDVSYSGDAARILKNGKVIVDWTTGGSIDNVPQGGGYVLEAKTGSSITAEDLNIGVVVVSMGQSNMENWYAEPTATTSAPQTFMLGIDGQWAPVTGPGAIEFSDVLSTELGVPVAMVNAAVGGTSLLPASHPNNRSHWLDTDPGSLYADALQMLGMAGGRAEIVLWAQGEADGSYVVKENATEEYAEGLQTLFERINEDFDTPQILIQPVGGTIPASVDIRLAQEQVVESLANAAFGATVTDLAPTEQGHFDAPSYMMAAGRMAVSELALMGIDASRARQAGGETDDFFTAAGSSEIHAGAGNDHLKGSAKGDALFGEAGNDVVQGRLGDDIVFGGDGDDTLYGGNGDDGLSGGAGNDLLIGGAGNDDLWGTYGDDTLQGGEGDDTLSGGSGTNMLDGGIGNDTVSYVLAGQGVTVDLSLIGPQDNGTAIDTLSSIENLVGSSEDDILIGDSGNNFFDGALGADILGGGAGDDTITGGGGNDALHGGDGDDALDGGKGNDILDGGAGTDTMAGGLSGDTYYVDNAADQVIEAVGGGTDTVCASVDYILTAGQEIEYFSANAGATGLSLTGNEFRNILTGGVGDDTLEGGEGNDVLNGGDGSDTASYASAGAGVTVSLAIASRQNTQGARLDTLSSIENLAGSAFADTLTGAAGANILVGGGGDDRYYVDDTADQVIEATGGSVDTVYAKVPYVLTAGQEIEYLHANGGAAGLSLTGNEFGNTITGGAGHDTLDGGAGMDTLIGGLLGDTYYVDDAADPVIEAVGGGTSDTVYASVDYTLAAGQEIEYFNANAGAVGLSLGGNEFRNILTGGAGDDTLDGDDGNDVLNGGDGSDAASYASAGAGVTVSLAIASRQNTQGGGLDTLSSIENLAGSAFVDTLTGAAGANILAGGRGDDRYYVDDTADQVIEATGGGVDAVYTKADYTLAAGQEVEYLYANAGAAGLSLTGNEFGNTITGGAGHDTLDGAGGIDTMVGEFDGDTYYVDNTADQVIEAVGDGTSDTIYASVDYALATGQEIEYLSANAGATGLSLSGNKFRNIITGGAGNDTLDGGDGNDTLNGGAGNDVLFGGAGNDTFLFDTALGPANIDSLAGFDGGMDAIQLAHSVFAAFDTADGIPRGAFRVGDAALQADDRLIYNSTTGDLFYDPDGVGGIAQQQFAILTNVTGTITRKDFEIV